jgi:hypothetical protein
MQLARAPWRLVAIRRPNQPAPPTSAYAYQSRRSRIAKQLPIAERLTFVRIAKVPAAAFLGLRRDDDDPPTPSIL